MKVRKQNHFSLRGSDGTLHLTKLLAAAAWLTRHAADYVNYVTQVGGAERSICLIVLGAAVLKGIISPRNCISVSCGDILISFFYYISFALEAQRYISYRCYKIVVANKRND